MEKEINIVKWVNSPNILERNAKAEAYIEECARKRNEKRKVNIDVSSQNCTMCVLAGALLLALVTIIL